MERKITESDSTQVEVIQVAVKVVKKALLQSHPKMKLYLQAELDNMKSLNHPNIISYLDDYEDSLNHYIVMEYCAGGSLKDYLTKHGRLSELEV